MGLEVKAGLVAYGYDLFNSSFSDQLSSLLHNLPSSWFYNLPSNLPNNLPYLPNHNYN